MFNQKKFQRRISKKDTKFKFDKYELYKKSVQSAENDVRFIWNTYKDMQKIEPVAHQEDLVGGTPSFVRYKKTPTKSRKKTNKKIKTNLVLREDFCGTGALSQEWIKLSKNHQAYAVDLDPEPIEYALSHYYPKLTSEQQKRLNYREMNVLDRKIPPADIVLAMNFSYFCFKSREVMKTYFKNVYDSLNEDGVFICDIFGGSQCYDAIEDKVKHKGFTYYWDQAGFDPITNEATFYIHFKIGSKKIEKVFTYDWRLWSMRELREIMYEVGFKSTHVYWEGTNRSGGGNGIFTRTETGEACLSWIAYIVGAK